MIKHPEIDPVAISKALGLEPEHAWKRGEQRKTPTGALLPGVQRETYWCCSFPGSDNQSTGTAISAIVSKLWAHKQIWSQLLDAGGSAQLVLSVVGTKSQGATIDAEVVRMLGDLGISLGIEIYAVPQN